MKALQAFAHLFKRNWFWLRWVLAAVVLACLVYRSRDGFRDLSQRTIVWRHLLVGLALCASSIVMTYFRWYLLVYAQEFPFRLRDALRLGFIGFACNYVAPGGSGGDVLKALMMIREQSSRRIVAVSTIALDRILGMLALFIVGSIVVAIPTPLVANAAFKPVIAFYLAGAIGGTIGLGALLHPAVTRWRLVRRLTGLRYVGRALGELVNAVVLYQSRWRVLVISVLISILGHVMMLSSFYFCALALHPAADIPDYWTHLQLVPAAETAGVLAFFLPGGLGALEGSLDVFYVMAGATAGAGFLTGVAYRTVNIVIAGVGAGYYWAARREIDEALHTADVPQPTTDQQ